MEPTRGGGDPAFLNRNSGKLKVFMDQHRPEHLVAELPMDPSRPLAAVRDEDAWTFMEDLVQNHHGELREISGEWQWQSTPFPEDRPEFFHHQFAFAKANPFSGKGWKQKGSQGKGGKVAAGTSATQPDNSVVMRDWADPHSHWLRVAKVFGLADLFFKLGDTFTAKQLYMYYTSTRVIVYKRPHGRSAPERVEAAQRRYKNTGRYGFQS